MADFSLLQTPNFSGALLGGYQAGQSAGRQKQLDTAMSNIDLERPETILPILRADPATGAALLGTSMRYAEQKHELAKSAAIGDAFGKYFSGGGTGTAAASSSSSPSTPALPAGVAAAMSGTAPAPATPSDPNEVVVTAQRPAPSPQANMGQAITSMVSAGVPIEQAQHFVQLVGSMDEQQKKYLDDKQDALAHAALTLKALPVDQRAAKLQQLAPDLLQHHVTPQQIQSAPLDDASLDGFVRQSLAVKDALAVKREDAAAAETHRHNVVDEGQGAARVGIEAGNLGVARGNLGVSKQRLSDEEKGIIGKGGTGGGLPPVQQRLLADGTHAYRNPATGKWYDNPEFK